jgi:hypothetical protein
MRAAARFALVWLAAIAGACSLSLDGDRFRGGDPVAGDEPDAGRRPGHERADARAPESDDPDAAPPADPDLLTCDEETCKLKCEHRACTIDCREVDTCEAGCKDATCTIDCTGARECNHVKCQEGSGCLLDCSDSERCGFDDCDGEVTSCPGDLYACNRPCP